MKTITNKFKLALATVGLFAIGTATAQQTSGNITTQGNATPNTTGTAVRVIDNKGTKKFLQVANGITSLTNQTPAGGITTTWQLGGTLTSETTIDLDGQTFRLDGANVELDNIDDTSLARATAYDGTGYTLLVRDEQTGKVEKLLASDLIESGQTYFTAAVADQVAGPTAAELAFDVTAGTPNLGGLKIPLPNYERVWVYRNGAKLVANLDYTIAGSVVTLVPNTTAPNDWTLYAGDIIEVQYIK